MTLRSRQTRWFEAFVRREQVVYALEALASTYSVELELDPRFTGSLNIRALAKQLREFDRLAAPYKHLLPSSARQATRLLGPPDEVAHKMVERLRAWIERLAPIESEIAALDAQLEQLRILQGALEAMGTAAKQLPLLVQQTQLLYKGLYVCPSGRLDRTEHEQLIEEVHEGAEHDYVILACLPEQKSQVQQVLAEADCEPVPIPEDLASNPEQQKKQLKARIKQNRETLAAVKRKLHALQHDRYMAEALANIETLHWFTGAAHHVGEKDARFCHITGWTSEPDAQKLEAVLHSAHVDAEVRFTEPPRASKKPVPATANWWTQPFQVFTAMWGPPSHDEVDPTGLLAIVVPLLFGYMFPDTGHGLVIAVIGLVISRRWPKARFLITCGLAAALMGLLFDDFFGYSILNAPWQLHALDNPLLVLSIPIVFGIGLLLLGLVFNGVEAYWRRELRRWLLSDAAVLVIYLSLLAGTLYNPALWGAAVALIWYLLGSLALGDGKPAARISAAAGHLLHSTLTLLLNTISFVRVGAFALAHEGLSYVVVTLTGAIDNTLLFVPAFVIGHAFVIALEGLVVFVQTTRLVLFEFFMQFLRAEGRFFQPLATSRQADENPKD